MLQDGDTTIRSPHEVTKTRKAGKTETRVIDPRVSAEIQEDGAALTLFFDPERAHAGDADLVEVRLTPNAAGEFQPWKLIPRLPLHLKYVRAHLAHEREGVVAALRALQEADKTRRGNSNAKLRYVAELYGSLVREGEPYPIKAMAAMLDCDKSTASRWVSAARDRGFLPEEES